MKGATAQCTAFYAGSKCRKDIIRSATHPRWPPGASRSKACSWLRLDLWSPLTGKIAEEAESLEARLKAAQPACAPRVSAKVVAVLRNFVAKPASPALVQRRRVTVKRLTLCLAVLKTAEDLHKHALIWTPL